MRTLRRLTRHFLSALVDNDLIAAGEDLHASIAGILSGLVVVSGCVALIFLGKYNSVVAAVKGQLTAQFQTLPDKLAMALDDKALLLGGAMILMASRHGRVLGRAGARRAGPGGHGPAAGARPRRSSLAKAAAVTGAAACRRAWRSTRCPRCSSRSSSCSRRRSDRMSSFARSRRTQPPVSPDARSCFSRCRRCGASWACFPREASCGAACPSCSSCSCWRCCRCCSRSPSLRGHDAAAIETGAVATDALSAVVVSWPRRSPDRPDRASLRRSRARLRRGGRVERRRRVPRPRVCVASSRSHRTSAAGAGRRHQRRAASSRRPWNGWPRLLAADGRVRASFLFTARTLTRSPRHRLYLAGSLGLGLAVAGATIAAAAAGLGFGREALSLKSMALAAQLNLMFFLVVGIRIAATVPADLEAGWVFRFNVSHARERHVAGTRAAIFFLAVLPLLLLLAPAARVAVGLSIPRPSISPSAWSRRSGCWRSSSRTTPGCRSCRQFTPGRAVLSPRFGLYVFDYFLFAYATPGIEQLLDRAHGLLLRMAGAVRRRRRPVPELALGPPAPRPDAGVRRAAVEMQQLGLWDTVHSRTVPDGQHTHRAGGALPERRPRTGAARQRRRRGSRVWPGSQIGADIKYADQAPADESWLHGVLGRDPWRSGSAPRPRSTPSSTRRFSSRSTCASWRRWSTSTTRVRCTAADLLHAIAA